MLDGTSDIGTPARQCPTGCGNLTAFKFRGVDLEHCLHCAGIWFEVGECPALEHLPGNVLDELDELVTPAAVPSERRQSAGRNCPGCGVILSPYSYHVGQVVTVDRCDLCDGFWADHGEISAISDSLVARAHGPVPAHQIAETRLGLTNAGDFLSDGRLERGHIYQAFAAWLTHRGTA